MEKRIQFNFKKLRLKIDQIWFNIHKERMTDHGKELSLKSKKTPEKNYSTPPNILDEKKRRADV